MFFKNRKKKEEENSSNKQQLEITEGMNAERCSSECFKAVMMPTVTVIS